MYSSDAARRALGALPRLAYLLADWAGLPAAAAMLLDDSLLLFVPVLVNLGLLGAFGWTLLRRPPLIESLARLQAGAARPTS